MALNFFITLTTACDLQCRYCYGECCDDFDCHDDGLDVDHYLPRSINYDMPALKNFMAKDPEPTIIFYGGEPLLEIEKMKSIMDSIPSSRFLLHTNGTMLDRIDPEYLNRLNTISISIDGDKALTDYYRGEGVYKKIMENAMSIRSKGFNGELIARMTVMEGTDIYRQAFHLLKNDDFSFDSIHWQLNALFWRNDYGRRKFSEWANESYLPGVYAMIKEWVRVMKDEGRVLKIYPFVAIIDSLLKNESSLLRCGAGWAEFNIQTDGRISPCPVMSGLKDYYAGDIRYDHPLKLKSFHVSGPCNGCSVKGLCGGRCLYANVTMKWGEKGFSDVCSVVKGYLGALQEAYPEIKKLIDGGIVKSSDFEHMKFNSCEIIP